MNELAEATLKSAERSLKEIAAQYRCHNLQSIARTYDALASRVLEKDPSVVSDIRSRAISPVIADNVEKALENL